MRLGGGRDGAVVVEDKVERLLPAVLAMLLEDAARVAVLVDHDVQGVAVVDVEH